MGVKLTSSQAHQLIKKIDLIEPGGEQTWKLILHGRGVSLADNVNFLLRRNNLYLTTKLAELIAEKMK